MKALGQCYVGLIKKDDLGEKERFVIVAQCIDQLTLNNALKSTKRETISW